MTTANAGQHLQIYHHRKPLSVPPSIQILKTRAYLEFKKMDGVQVCIGGVQEVLSLICYQHGLHTQTASSCTSISSSCTSIIFKIPIIDMSKLQNYPCCCKRRFSMEGVRYIYEQR